MAPTASLSRPALAPKPASFHHITRSGDGGSPRDTLQWSGHPAALLVLSLLPQICLARLPSITTALSPGAGFDLPATDPGWVLRAGDTKPPLRVLLGAPRQLRTKIQGPAVGCDAGCPVYLLIPSLSSALSSPSPPSLGHLSPFPPSRVHPGGISQWLAPAHPWHMHNATSLAAGCDSPQRWDTR